MSNVIQTSTPEDKARVIASQFQNGQKLYETDPMFHQVVKGIVDHGYPAMIVTLINTIKNGGLK